MRRRKEMLSEMKTLVSMGRGGVGKTSFVALMTKYFIEIGETPLFLIDADPDQSLGDMVGVDLEEAGKKTISDVIYGFLDEGGTVSGVAPVQRMEGKLWQDALYEGDEFDMMVIGPKWVEGCYCLPNTLVKKVLQSLSKNYGAVLIDSPAGLEHLNRRITSQVNDIFDIMDPSKKSFDHIRRAYRIIQELIEFDNFYIIGGYEFPKELEKRVGELDLKYLGKIPSDEKVRERILEGESLLDLPVNSPAYQAVKEITRKAGYAPLREPLP